MYVQHAHQPWHALTTAPVAKLALCCYSCGLAFAPPSAATTTTLEQLSSGSGGKNFNAVERSEKLENCGLPLQIASLERQMDPKKLLAVMQIGFQGGTRLEGWATR